MTPEALDGLAPEERRRIYKMTELEAVASLIAPASEVGNLEIASWR